MHTGTWRRRWKDLIPYPAEQQHALKALAVEDMSALPDVQEEGQRIYLTDGRFLDVADTQEGWKVCLINNGFASLRGLEVGDTLTLTLKDVPSYFGYCLSPEGREEHLALWREGQLCSRGPQDCGHHEYTDGDRFLCATVRNNFYPPPPPCRRTLHMSTVAHGSGVLQHDVLLGLQPAKGEACSVIEMGPISGRYPQKVPL